MGDAVEALKADRRLSGYGMGQYRYASRSHRNCKPRTKPPGGQKAETAAGPEAPLILRPARDAHPGRGYEDSASRKIFTHLFTELRAGSAFIV